MATASLSPPTRPALMLITRQAPISSACRACRAREDALVQADGRAELRLQPAVVPDVVFGQRLLDQQQVQVVERLQRGRGLQRVGRVGVHLQPDCREGAAHGLRIRHIAAGLDLDLDPAGSPAPGSGPRSPPAPSGEACRPTDTPTSTRSRVPPSSSRSDLPWRLPSRSHSAISSPALAIGWPRTWATRRWKSAGPATSWPRIAGMTKSCRMCQAVPAVS